MDLFENSIQKRIQKGPFFIFHKLQKTIHIRSNYKERRTFLRSEIQLRGEITWNLRKGTKVTH